MKNIIKLFIDIFGIFFGKLTEPKTEEKNLSPLPEPKKDLNTNPEIEVIENLLSSWTPEKKDEFIKQSDNQIIFVETQYNWQLNNTKYKNLSPASQCGYTSAGIFLSHWIPNIDDNYIDRMVNELDKDYLIDKTKTRQGAYQNTYSKYFKNKLPDFKIITRPHSGTREEILEALKNGSPVFTSTMITTHGHYIVITGFNYQKSSYIVQDPFGFFDFDLDRYTNTKEFSISNRI